MAIAISVAIYIVSKAAINFAIAYGIKKEANRKG
jgi:hypothetical protein